jgi:signal transduction histidine kinase
MPDTFREREWIVENRIDYGSGNFLAAVQHNLRTPLAGLMGYTELALEELQEHESRDELENVISNLQKSLKCFEGLDSEVTILSGRIKALNL